MADIARKVQELQREEEFRRKLEEIRMELNINVERANPNHR